MPTVFSEGGVRFSFFSNEGDPREPIHIHAFGPGKQAKLWLIPEVRIVDSAGFSRHEQRFLVEVVSARRGLIETAWNDHFGQGPEIR